MDKGIARIRKIYQSRVDKGKMSEMDLESKMGLVTATTDYEAFKDVDLIIEAVPEKMDLKKQIFKELDEVCHEGAILATNTSALSISELSSATKRPDKVVGIHFFFPANVMKLVEVIPGLATSEDTIADSIGFVESIRKMPVARERMCRVFGEPSLDALLKRSRVLFARRRSDGQRN